MNADQTRLMRWLDSEWAKHQRAANLPCDRDARLAFYAKCIGRSVTSSKQLRNDDVTDIKRRVLALVQPANFPAQMKSQVDNDPDAIRARYLQEIDGALHVLKPDHDFAEPAEAGPARVNYASATARNMFDKDLGQLDQDQLRKLAGLFKTRAKARQKRDAKAAAPAVDDGDPF